MKLIDLINDEKFMMKFSICAVIFSIIGVVILSFAVDMFLGKITLAMFLPVIPITVFNNNIVEMLENILINEKD